MAPLTKLTCARRLTFGLSLGPVFLVATPKEKGSPAAVVPE